MAKQKKEQKTVIKTRPPANTWLTGKRLYALVVFFFSFALYLNTLNNDYNLDDELVTQNHWATSKGWDVLKFNFDAFSDTRLSDSSFAQKVKYFLPVIFRVPYYQDKSGFKYEYRPMVFASFALEHALFAKKTTINGTDVETDLPWVSHLINVLLYGLLCMLLFTVLCRLFTVYNILFPFIISLLFAAYPMHTEVVASIKNRDEMLALIFGLLSLNFSLAYIKKNKAGYLFLILLFFVSGILSKPTSVTFALLIPLCLVVFTNAGYRKLILLAAVLIIPSVLYSRVYSAVQQITLGVVLFAAVIGLYILKNRVLFRNGFKSLAENIYSYFKNSSGGAQEIDQGFDPNIIKQLWPLLLILLGVLIPCCISAYGISIRDPWLSSLPLFFSCALYIVVNNELKAVFTTPITLVTLFAMTRFLHHASLAETGLIIFLASQIFSGQKVFRAVGTINYILFSAVSFFYLHSYHFLFIILFIGLLNRKLFVVTLLLLAGTAILFIRKLFGIIHGGKSVQGFVVLFPLIYAFVFLLWRGRWKQAINASVAILPISFMVYFMWMHPLGNHSTYLAAQRAYYRINSIKAADPAPVQSVRPLNYPEYPLSNNGPLSLRFGTSMEVLGKYLQKVLVPYPMSYYYGYSYITPQKLTGFFPMLSLLAHLLLFGAAIYFFRKDPVLSFSVLFYLISIAVFSNLVTPIPGMIADRLLLIPSIGFCVFAVYILSRIFKQGFEGNSLTLNSLHLPIKVALAVILIIYSGLTFSRNTQWKDQVTLFRHDITVVENSAQAQNLLGVHLLLLSNRETDKALQKELREEAIPHFKKALEIYPQFLNASYDLGRTYEALGLSDQAFEQFQATVKIDTGFFAPYFNMATILHNKGRYAASIPLYQKFLTQYPNQLEAYTDLSFAYFQLKDFENSIATNRRAIAVTGNVFYPTVNVAKTYTVMGQTDSALFYFEKAHALHPNDAGVNLNIEKLKGKTP